MRDTMPLEMVLDLESGDHGGPMRGFPQGRFVEWYWTDYDYQKVDVIAESMATRGWDGPPVFVVDGVLRNGHHRTIAAYLAGLDTIPITDVWSESDDRRDLEDCAPWFS